MIDNICTFLTNRIRKEMPEVDDEKAEIIFFGLQNMVGEIPKTILMILIAFFLGILKETLIAFFMILPYRAVSGGFHLKTHLGCIVGTCSFYFGIVLLAKYIVLNPIAKYVLISVIWGWGMIMIKKYVPADTENVPILESKVRRKKQVLAYIIYTIGLAMAILIENNVFANMLIFGSIFQTFAVTKLAYKLTKNKYGYEVYRDELI